MLVLSTLHATFTSQFVKVYMRILMFPKLVNLVHTLFLVFASNGEASVILLLLLLLLCFS